MITKIELTNQTTNLEPFLLENPPSLMVIAGTNGAGKTALLNLINKANGQLPANLIVTPVLKRKVKYVNVGYVPGDIASPNDPRQQSEQRIKQIVDYISTGTWNKISYNQVALETLKKLNTSISELDTEATNYAKGLSESEISNFLPNDLALILQNFQNNEFIAEVCITYNERINSFKIQMYDEGIKITEEELYTKIGSIPPWEEINQLFERYGFAYRLSVPVNGIKYFPMFHKLVGDSIVSFNQLSSGEKILVTLVLWGFNSRQANHTNLLLLDEFDAHLNPSLAKMMMEIISKTLIAKNGLSVIMTTHSPSTVAFTDDQNLFWMEASKPIRPATKAEIIPLLSDGFIAVQPDQALGIIGTIVDTSNKPILCVEGVTDREILTTAWSKIKGDTDMPFIIHDVFDCYFLLNMFKRADIFTNYPNKMFLGLLDFDSAYTDAKEKLPKQGWKKQNSLDPVQVVFTHPEKKGALMTLPVPSEREHYAGANIANSYLSIELLFADEIIEPYCVSKQVAGGASLLEFKNKKKVEFATTVKALQTDCFINFIPLFDQLIKISSTE